MRISGTNKIVHFLVSQVVFKFKLFLSSITRRVVTESPKPEAYVLCIRAFRVELEFRSAGFFEERGKPEYPGKNLSEHRKNQQQT